MLQGGQGEEEEGRSQCRGLGTRVGVQVGDGRARSVTRGEAPWVWVFTWLCSSTTEFQPLPRPIQLESLGLGFRVL